MLNSSPTVATPFSAFDRLGQTFNGILNTGLQEALDTDMPINHCQIGFQPKARTVDHKK